MGVFGPDFGLMQDLSSEMDVHSPARIAEQVIQAYKCNKKGYVRNNTASNRAHNTNLIKNYENDPRVFWSNSANRCVLPKCIVLFALFCHSVRSSSASPEREFSRMGWMISSRRASVRPKNADKRLVMGNLLPQKRRLEIEMEKRNIKMKMLFDYC